ncbi:MAG: PilZ domain-containing protein [Sphingomicrobium sp.]
MSAKFSLDGGMIPRAVKRMFDERAEDRIDSGSQTAALNFRGRRHVVRLINVSRVGAMLRFSEVPHIGEEVGLQLMERDEVPGHVRWVREGCIGIHFATVLE